MTGRPRPDEAAPFYANYLNQAPGDDPIAILQAQLEEAAALCGAVDEQRSLHRYADDKWSIRQVLSHITDTERVFTFRAFWFGRGYTDAMPSMDQNVAAAGAEADRVAWAAHVAEFRAVRQATISLFRNLPPAAWSRSGVASGNPVTVRALAFLAAGHAAHHLRILRERYL